VLVVYNNGPNGKVYVCWAGVTSVSPFTEDFVGVASTTNGGANWQVSENAFDMNGINGLLTQKGNIRVNGLPNIAMIQPVDQGMDGSI